MILVLMKMQPINVESEIILEQEGIQSYVSEVVELIPVNEEQVNDQQPDSSLIRNINQPCFLSVWCTILSRSGLFSLQNKVKTNNLPLRVMWAQNGSSGKYLRAMR